MKKKKEITVTVDGKVIKPEGVYKIEKPLVINLTDEEFKEIANATYGNGYFKRKNTPYWYARFMDKAGNMKYKYITLKRGKGKDAATMPCQIKHIRITPVWVEWGIDGIDEFIIVEVRRHDV